MFITKSLKRLFSQIQKTPVSKVDLAKDYQRAVQKTASSTGIGKTATYEQMINLINSPQMIKHIEIYEYGVELPKVRRSPAWLLFAVSAFIYYHYLSLPEPIV